MNKDVNIKIKANADTHAIDIAKRDLKSLGKTVTSVSKQTQGLSSYLNSLGKSFLAVIGINELLDKTVRKGFEINSEFENLASGLSSLILVTSSSTSIFGEHLSLTEKQSLANIEAANTLKKLIEESKNAPISAEEMVRVYDTLYVSMKKAGASTKEMVEITKKIAIASQAGGVDINSLIAGVDGLASGTVLANSDLGRFLSSLGLTNEALKKTGNVAELVIDKLKNFTKLDTMSTAVSNFKDTWDELMGDMTKSSFVKVKEDIKGLTEFLEKNKESILKITTSLSYGFDLLADRIDVSILTVWKWANSTSVAIKTVTNFLLGGLSESVKKSLERDRRELKLTNKQIDIMEGKYKQTRLAYDALINPPEVSGKFSIWEKLREVQDGLLPNAEKEKANAGAGLKVWSDYFKGIGELQKAWLASPNRRDAFDRGILLGLKGDDLKNYVNRYKNIFLKGLEKETKKTADVIESTAFEMWKSLREPISDRDVARIKDKMSEIRTAQINYFDMSKQYSSEWKVKEEDIRIKNMGLLTPKEINNLVSIMKTDFFKSVDNLSKKTSSNIDIIFKSLTDSVKSGFDSFFDYTSDKFMKFGDLAKSVLHDIYMQIMKIAVINPAVSGIMGGISGLFGSNIAPNLALSLKGYANGGVFANNIVQQPTLFGYGGQFGIMGESGAEAIMPLSRKNGVLGVRSTPSNVVINIENRSGINMDLKKISEGTDENGNRTINTVLMALETNPDFRSAIRGVL